jgi:tetratricopeptide (TPR) repeat protein
MPRNVHPMPFVIRPSDDLAKNIDLRNMSRSLATKYADGHVVTDDDLQIMGRMLWNSLGVENDFKAAVKAAGDAILSIIIESDRPEVQAFPWETLYHPSHGFIGRNPAFTLTRRIAEGKPAQANLDKGPLRVLLFTSLPDNVDAERGRLNVEEEQAQVQEALLPWIAKGVVQLEMPDDGRFSTLKELLQGFDPHVLFLSGHGKFHHEPHADEAYGSFWFEGETGDGESIRDEEIARVLVGTRVQAVILSACESGKAASDYLSNGLMQRISAAGIPHVIGMRESIYDIAGIQFARALCDALAGQERLDVALQSARAAIQKAMDERGQWCLPMALSPNPQAQLIDWDFQPHAAEVQQLNQRVNFVSLPARFVGRRAEMRKYKIKLTQGALLSLLITGAAGMGKTSLAGKLALDVQKARGDGLFAWSANSEKSWRDFELEMGQTLDKPRVERYDKFLPKAENEAARAKFMFDLLAEQFNGRVILFLDNLETLQDADSLAVKDATVAAWMQAARGTDGVTIFATSRWQIPDWDGEHLMLARANYGDFLQIAAMKNLPIRREQMRRVYDSMGGNIRGLEFFAAAVQSMDDENAEEAFLQMLEQTKSDLQVNMAIAEIYKCLSDDAKKLLARLPAYHEAVPMEGLLKLGADFPEAESLLERLMAVSLLEASYEPHWDATEYQCAPMVTDWMKAEELMDDGHEWLNIVADYHLYLFNIERKTLAQAIITHHALRRVERHNEADRLTLDYIVNPMTRAGFYETLLNEWLPRICKSEDHKTRAEALGQTGNLLFHIGDHETALDYLKQSLTIRQQIGDKAGEGVTLNNIGQIYFDYTQGDYEIALSYFEQSLSIMQKIDSKEGQSTTLSNIAQIYHARGDYKMAIGHLQQTLAIQQQIGDKKGEGTTLNNISEVYHSQGDYKMGLFYLKKSLTIMKTIGNKVGESGALNNISQIYYVQGDYETTLTYLKQALVIQKQIGDKKGEGTTLNNISSIYHSQGDYETALDYLKQSLVICQQIGNKVGEGTNLNNISQIYFAQGDYKTTLSHLIQALAIVQQVGDKAKEGATLNNISQIFQSQGDYETALDYLKQSLVIHQQIGDKEGEGTTLFNVGLNYAQNKQMQEAAGAWVNSYLIAKQIGHAKILQALAELAPKIGLPEGLDGWEQLAQRMQSGSR